MSLILFSLMKDNNRREVIKVPCSKSSKTHGMGYGKKSKSTYKKPMKRTTSKTKY